MTTTDMAAQILEYVRRLDHVTFANLADNIPGFEGDYEIYFGERNWVLWSGVSQEAAAALHKLRSAGSIVYVPTALLTYLIDGCTLSYPIVKSARRYKSPHWLPMVVRPAEKDPSWKLRKNAR